MTTKDEIIETLAVVDRSLASRVLERYLEMRTLESVRRWEDCLDEAGKFAEEVYRFVYLAVKGTPLAEVENMDDLRKRRFRTPPGIPGAIYKEMGVTAIALPGAEIIPSAERGVLDAAEWCCPVTDLAYGFHRAFKYYYLQGLHQNTVNADVYINKNFWNKLPKDVQAIFEGAALASLMESTAYRIRANALALIELKTKHGVQVMETPPDYFPAFMAAAKKVMEENAAKNAFFKKVLDSQAAFAKDVVPYWVSIQKLNTSVADSYLKGGAK